MSEAEIEALEAEMQMILTGETPDTEVGTEGSLEDLEAEMAVITMSFGNIPQDFNGPNE